MQFYLVGHEFMDIFSLEILLCRFPPEIFLNFKDKRQVVAECE